MKPQYFCGKGSQGQMQKRTLLPETGYTHGGRFHADDVFSTALLRMLNPKIKIQRVMELSEDTIGIIYDIGRGEFDHHQPDAPIRDNGVPYAACGLLWRKFGPYFFTSKCGEERIPEAVLQFDESFVQPLDLDDNTGCGNMLASIIGSFNPYWDENSDGDQNFWKAVQFAQEILERKLGFLYSQFRADTVVEEAIQRMEDGIVKLPVYAPWKPVVVRSDAEFVIYPSQRGGYCAQAVPGKEEGSLRCPFPISWAGKENQELEQVSEINGLRFCHRARFLVSADTAETCVKACQEAQRQEQNIKKGEDH